jgi:CelD/BcsL family acetyltransferase involved in cellulose biosynthesis
MSAVPSELEPIVSPSVERKIRSVRICRAWAELEQFYAGWNSLLQACPGASIFQTPEWLGAWWQAFGAGKELLALVFMDAAETPLGLALLYIEEEKHALGMPLRVLRMAGAGSGDSDALDLVTAPGDEKLCAEAFIAWLAENRQWDICALETLPAASLAARHIAEQARKQGWQLYCEASPNFYIPLPATWKDYLDGLESSFRPLLTRYPRRLQSRYRVCMERCEREQDLDSHLQTLFALHQMRWTGRGEPGAFSSVERRDFYSRMARAFLRRGWLEFWLLKLDQEIVAAQFCFRYGDTVYLLQEGFHPKHTGDRVGYALRARVLEEMIRTGAARYDFLGGADAYKAKFGAREGSYLTLRFAGPSTRGRLRLAWQHGKKQARQWLKRKLPAPVLAALRRDQGKDLRRQTAQ